MKRPVAQPGARWAFMLVFKVKAEDGVGTYLWRLRMIQTPWFGIFLHRINEADYQDPHNHPWSFFYSLVLKGWYEEAVWEGEDDKFLKYAWKQRHGMLSLHRINGDQFHRIINLKKPTWTLLLVGPRVQQWGFWPAGEGWVQWDQYIGSIDTRERIR